MQVCTSLQTDNHASTPPLREETNLKITLGDFKVCRVTHAAVLSHAYLLVIVRSFGDPGTIVKPRMTVTVFDY